MHSGNGNGVRRKLDMAPQLVFLPQILSAYLEKGFWVRRVLSRRCEQVVFQNPLTDADVSLTLEQFVTGPDGLLVRDSSNGTHGKWFGVSFYEFHTALEKGLPPLAAVPLGRAGGR